MFNQKTEGLQVVSKFKYSIKEDTLVKLDSVISLAKTKPNHQLDCKRCGGNGYVYGNIGQTCWQCNGTLKYDNKWLTIIKKAESSKAKIEELTNKFNTFQIEVNERTEKRAGKGLEPSTFRQERLNSEIQQAIKSMESSIDKQVINAGL
jgi:hypothetical protein